MRAPKAFTEPRGVKLTSLSRKYQVMMMVKKRKKVREDQNLSMAHSDVQFFGSCNLNSLSKIPVNVIIKE